MLYVHACNVITNRIIRIARFLLLLKLLIGMLIYFALSIKLCNQIRFFFLS